MSSSFIGSKIAIITKSQYRYVGTIIGIDSQVSSILLGNVKCFGTENRAGSISNTQMVGTVVPIMQFANSDIEDLKIVDEEQTAESQNQQKSISVLSSPPLPPPPPAQKQSSIHDDPAIVSAVVSTSNKDLSMTNRLVHDLHQLKLSDDKSKTDESRLRSGSGELGPSWSSLSPSKWETNKPPIQPQPTGNKSKFFDDFLLNSTEQSNRSQQRWPSNTQSSRQNEGSYRHEHHDDNGLPVREPFFSNDRPYPPQQQQQQLQQQHHHQQQQQQQHHQQYNRHQNGHAQQHQQRYFYNNRRGPMNNHYHRRTGDGNRETFNDNGNSYEDEFDFETNNRKFNKITSEEELNDQSEVVNQLMHLNNDPNLSGEFEPIYDKKKSFFDNIKLEDTSNVSGPMYNRSRNQDTFGNERNQRQKYRGNTGTGGYRRSNYNNYRPNQRNDDYYRQNNNGYHYRN